MSCTAWNDSLIGRLYGELDAEQAAALAEHLERCADCREELDDFQRVRTALHADAQEAEAAPRVMVLNTRRRLGWMALAASMFGAAALAGLIGGVGYAAGRRAAPPPADQAMSMPATPGPDTEALVRQEVDRRFEELASTIASAARNSGDRAVSSPELKAELAKLEKKMDGVRAADLEFLLDQIGASEFRTGARIGKTNDALRTVALASNPRANEQ